MNAFVRKRFTMKRWGTNPAQMWELLFVYGFSLVTLVYGASEDTVLQQELDRISMYFVSICNLIGGTATLYGLHVKDFDRSIKIEAWGYVSLLTIMSLWSVLFIVSKPFPNTSFGLALSMAFVFAGIHRVIQIVKYFRAKKRGDVIAIWAMLGRLEKPGKMP